MIARRLPWWVLSLLGGACVVLGAVLIAKPFRSLSVLAVVVAATMILTGVSEFASGAGSTRPRLSRAVGLGWLVVGVVALSWPGITIHALAIAVGIALVAGGVAKIISAVRSDGDERYLHAVTGLTNVVVGGLALTWPVVTVLVMAVIFGGRTALFGVAQVALGLRLRGAPAGSTPAEAGVSAASRWPGRLRLTGAVVALVLALSGVAISVAVQRARPAEPATNLVAGQSDTNGATDVFLYERATGAVTLVSHTPASATTTANGASFSPSISADGAFVAFQSFADLAGVVPERHQRQR